MSPKLFIATPLHNGWVHHEYCAGLAGAMTVFGLVWNVLGGTSLPRQRDRLTGLFLETDCTHLLWVDSDIAWRAGDVNSLLQTGKDFVAGCYGRKVGNGPIPTTLTGEVEGELYEATHVATGFLLVSRAAVEKMVEHFADLRYTDAGSQKTVTALFMQALGEGTEDLSFCRRWREVGGRVWLHSGIKLGHFDGNTCFMPNVDELPARAEAARASRPVAAE